MLKVGIIGVTGYTGMELARILLIHPRVQLSYASSRSQAGQKIGEAIPHIGDAEGLVLSAFEVEDAAANAGFFFVCLPHGQSMETVAMLRQAGVKVVDLSADFRLNDPSVYENLYGSHSRADLLPEAVYGLPELYRERIRSADLVANPGCYPTSVILGLAPLLTKGLIDPDTLVIDSKSGVSGAGREHRPDLHFPEVFGNFSAYNIAGGHRHIGEMEQELSLLAGSDVSITFTQHLLPVSRGILSTIYARPSGRSGEDELHSAYLEFYKNEPFVRVTGPEGSLPSLKNVRGTNLCCIASRLDKRTRMIVIVSCIDNLFKGASGQAVQNMNIMMGFDETAGISQTAMHP